MKHPNKVIKIVAIVITLLITLAFYSSTNAKATIQNINYWNGYDSDDSNNYYYTSKFYYWSTIQDNLTEYEGGRGVYVQEWDAPPYLPTGIYDKDDHPISTNAFDDFGFRSYSTKWITNVAYGPGGGRPWWVNYVRRAEVQYSRTKTTPYIIGNNIESAAYVSGNNYWIKTGGSVAISADSRQEFYGQIPLNDYIQNDNVGLFGPTEEYANQWRGNSNPVSQWKNQYGASIWGMGTSTTNTKGYSGYQVDVDFHSKYGVQVNRDDADYEVKLYASSRNGRSNSWTSTGKLVRTDGHAPTATKVYTANENSEGYDVIVEGVSDSRSGVNRVQFPTWTDKKGPDGNPQDDIQANWDTNPAATGQNLGGGTWKYHVSRSDHNNESGIYNTHIYLYDNVGNSQAVGGFSVPLIRALNGSASVSGTEYTDPNGKIYVQKGNTFTIKVDGYTDYYYDNNKINSLFAIIRDDSWNQTYYNAQIGNGQSESSTGGTHKNELPMTRYTAYSWRDYNWTAASWDASINDDAKTIYIYPLLRTYKNGDTSKDQYIMSESPWWESGKGVAVTSDGMAPTTTGATISNITTDGYDVIVTGVTDGIGSGINRVQFPTWTDKKDANGNDQDDIQQDWWNNTQATGQNLGNGTWKYHVNIKDHNYETGLYHTHIYVIDNVGNYSVKTFNDIVVPLWKNPSTVQNGVWIDNNGAPGSSVYTSLNGNKWVKPNQTFYIAVIGKSNSPDQQVDEDHLFVYNANNTSEQQTVKSGAVRHQLWTTNYWQDSSPLNSIQFVNGYGAARRNDDLSFNKDGDLLESYFRMKLLTDNTDYYQGSRALCLDGGRYYWSNNANFDIYNIIRTDGTAPSVTFTPNGTGWTNVIQNVLVNVSDSRSGVQNWRYSLSSDNGSTWGAWSSYITGAASQNIPITQQGQWKIKVESTDNVGNTGTTISNAYLLDLTNPSGTFTSNSSNWSTNNVSVYFDPSDTGGSGVSKWRYKISLDNGISWLGWSSYISGDNATYIPLTYPGEIKVLAEVTDSAGNIGTVTSPLYSLPVNTKPTAAFTVSTPKLENDTLIYSDTSGSNDSWDSIITKEWSYSFDGKANNDPTKTWSTPTSTPKQSFDLSEFSNNIMKGTYQVRLRVKDKGNFLSTGLWSDYAYQNVEIYRINTMPVARFTVTPTQQDIDEPLTYSNQSADPDGWDKIVQYEWSYKLKTDSAWIISGGTPPNVLKAYGVYTIRLRVKDQGNLLSPGLWSDYYAQDIEIKPFITIKGTLSPNPSPAGRKVTFNITTTGKAKRIKITFPPELTKLATADAPLIIDKNITIEPVHNEIIYAWLPTNTPYTLDDSGGRLKVPYGIEIEAENQYGIIVKGILTLDVNGSIYDGIKTGIKASGYDK